MDRFSMNDIALIKQAILETLEYVVLADRYQFELGLCGRYGDQIRVNRKDLEEQYQKVKTLLEKIT